MDNEFILAFDCGTTAIKAVLVNFDGQITCEAKEDLPLEQAKPGWAEQDPEVMWQRLCAASRGVIGKAAIDPHFVKGIVIAAPWKNVIPVDKNGEVLRKSLIWMDARATDQAARLNDKAGFFVGTGQEYWPRLMWVKENEPDIWKRADVIMGLNVFFKWKATGQIATEPHDDFIHAYNPNIQDYFDKVMAAAGLVEDLDKFPKAKLSTEKMGETIIEAAGEMGLVKGIPVFGGFGDLPAITIGTGCCQNDMVHIYFGTSSWLVDIIDERREGFAPQYFIFDPTHDGAMFGLQTGCLAFDWAVNQFYRVEKDILKGDILDFVDRDIRDIEAGSMDLIATHWLNGELPPLAKNAKAVFFNLTTNHDRRHMVKAVMESVCYTHRRYIDMYRNLTGKNLDSIRVVGGGAVSDLWMQILADVTQVEIQVPENPRYSGAMGSFYCAMIGLGRMKDYNAIYDAVKIGKVFTPRRENAEVYNKLYEIYLDLYPSLKNLYDRINGVY